MLLLFLLLLLLKRLLLGYPLLLLLRLLLKGGLVVIGERIISRRRGIRVEVFFSSAKADLRSNRNWPGEKPISLSLERDFR